MPLHLSQHKSYHPYNQVNRERVQRDEARAAEQEAKQRQTSFAHRDQARLEALRSARNNPGISPRIIEEPTPSSGSSQVSDRSERKPSRTGHSLIRPDDELKPWYTSPHLRNGADTRKTDDQRLEDAYKDSTVKSSNDPLKAMESFLAQRKAAKHIVQPSGSSQSHYHSERYEPEAVQAARSSRRHSSHHRETRIDSGSSRSERSQEDHRHHRHSHHDRPRIRSEDEDRPRKRSSRSHRPR